MECYQYGTRSFKRILGYPDKNCQGHSLLCRSVANEEKNLYKNFPPIAKKRSLDAPAKILLAGAEHLRNLQSESNCGNSAKSDFHLVPMLNFFRRLVGWEEMN
jgi:hypothetical protein